METRAKMYLQDTRYEKYHTLHVRGVADYTLVAKSKKKLPRPMAKTIFSVTRFCNERVIGNSPHV